MALINTIEQYLKDKPKARERVNRPQAVWGVLRLIYPQLSDSNLVNEDAVISRGMFVDGLFKDSQTINRLILKVQQDNEDLRGTDYEDKVILEQEVKLELGYEPGFNNDTSANTKAKMI